MEQIETATNNMSGSLCSTGQTIQNLTNQFTTIGGNLMMLRDTMETYRDKSSKDSEKVVAKQEETVEMLNNQK